MAAQTYVTIDGTNCTDITVDNQPIYEVKIDGTTVFQHAVDFQPYSTVVGTVNISGNKQFNNTVTISYTPPSSAWQTTYTELSSFYLYDSTKTTILKQNTGSYTINAAAVPTVYYLANTTTHTKEFHVNAESSQLPNTIYQTLDEYSYSNGTIRIRLNKYKTDQTSELVTFTLNSNSSSITNINITSGATGVDVYDAMFSYYDDNGSQQTGYNVFSDGDIPASNYCDWQVDWSEEILWAWTQSVRKNQSQITVNVPVTPIDQPDSGDARVFDQDLVYARVNTVPQLSKTGSVTATINSYSWSDGKCTVNLTLKCGATAGTVSIGFKTFVTGLWY